MGASAPDAPTVSGGVIKVGGIGYAANYGDAAIGAQARLQRANDTHEVKGYTFQWTEFADDKNDPATALSETRRLVTQDTLEEHEQVLTHTVTTELFDYDASPISAPLDGDDVTAAGQLPATVLKPQPKTRCGGSGRPPLTYCGQRAFDRQAAGKTADQFLGTLPKVGALLFTFDDWFPACGLISGPLPDGTQFDPSGSQHVAAASATDPATAR